MISESQAPCSRARVVVKLRRLRESIIEAVEEKCVLSGDPEMLEMPEVSDLCQGELQTRSGTSPKGTCMLKAAKLVGKVI